MAASQPNSDDVLTPNSDPWAIAKDPALDRPTKRRRLRELEQLVRQLQVATQEGMAATPDGQAQPSLREILLAQADVETQ
jgi:hypothetical protein